MARIAVVLITLILVGCGGGSTTVSGEELFNQSVLAGRPGCSSCHSLTPDQRLVGPSLAGIAASAATRVPGLSAREYLLQSLTEPDAFIVDGYGPGVMTDWDTVLGQDSIDALIDYLMTLDP